MLPAPSITRIGITKDQLGESPVWDARTQSLYWIDAAAAAPCWRCATGSAITILPIAH